MPYVALQLQPPPTPQQAAALARGITDAMANVMHKRRAVTAVRIDGSAAALWSVDGEACPLPTAYLDVKITAGTNSAAEKAELLRQLHALLVDTLGSLAAASYLVIHELPATDWGYGGVSQAARAGAAR